MSGKVSHAGWMKGYGYCVVIDHKDGSQTLYAHMKKGAIEKAGIKENMSVDKGKKIGAVGNTGHSHGNHLHFEYRYKGKLKNPAVMIVQIPEHAKGGRSCGGIAPGGSKRSKGSKKGGTS